MLFYTLRHFRDLYPFNIQLLFMVVRKTVFFVNFLVPSLFVLNGLLGRVATAGRHTLGWVSGFFVRRWGLLSVLRVIYILWSH